MSRDFRRDFSYSALDNEQVPPMGTPAPTAINMDQYEDVNIRVIHQVPRNKGMWTHIMDLDTFFANMYRYYISGGFKPILLSSIFSLIQIILIVLLSTFLLYCVNYPVPRNEENSTLTEKPNSSFVIYDSSVCIERISWKWWLLLTVCLILWLLIFCQSVYKLYHTFNIKLFYNNALKINDSDLEWTSWSTIQDRVKEAQKEHRMCIQKMELNELDIYHRILRFDNYMVAMVNKNVLPLQIKVPFYGNVHYLSKGLQWNLKILLFSSPWSPWENCWQLRSSYKDSTKRMPLSQQLEKQIILMALVNLLLCPFIMTWHILYFFLRYTEIIRRSPASLSLRVWSLYARIVLRHYNELEHEMQNRLNRAYKPATKYLASFSSPITTVIADMVLFISGGIVGAFVVLSILDEGVLNIPHVIPIITISGCVLACAKAMISEEEHLGIGCTGPARGEELFVQVLSHVHYLPAAWRNKAHTKDVAAHFQQLFQYRAIFILSELFSPLFTPFILYSLRTKALDIVDFYRHFTVSVNGIGDVCSFAKLDVQKHGHADWLPPGNYVDKYKVGAQNQCIRDESGKTELSLVAFSCRHPGWKPENPAQRLFLRSLRESINHAIPNCTGVNKTMLGSYIQQSLSGTATPLPTVLSFYPEQRQQIRIPEMDETSDEDEEYTPPPSRVDPQAQGFGDTSCSLAGVGSGLGINALGLEPQRAAPEYIEQTRDMSISALHLYEIHETQAKSNAQACCSEKCNERKGNDVCEVSLRTREDTPLLHRP